MKILLSPAKKMNVDAEALEAAGLPVFLKQTKEILKWLRSKPYEELKELASGKRERVYAAYGMADIDIFKSEKENKYCIEWSPNEASYNYYYFEKKDFEKDFVMAFMLDEEKEY